MGGTSLYKNAFGTGSFCQWCPSSLPQLHTSPVGQILHFVVGLSILCAAAVISSITTKSNLLQQLQPTPKGQVSSGHHQNHAGGKFPFSVVLLESNGFFSLHNVLNEVSFSFKK